MCFVIFDSIPFLPTVCLLTMPVSCDEEGERGERRGESNN